MNFQDRWPEFSVKVVDDLMQLLIVATLRDAAEELLAAQILERELAVMDTVHFNERDWVLNAAEAVAVREALQLISEAHPRRAHRVMETKRKGRFVFVKPPPEDDQLPS